MTKHGGGAPSAHKFITTFISNIAVNILLIDLAMDVHRKIRAKAESIISHLPKNKTLMLMAIS